MIFACRTFRSKSHLPGKSALSAGRASRVGLSADGPLPECFPDGSSRTAARRHRPPSLRLARAPAAVPQGHSPRAAWQAWALRAARSCFTWWARRSRWPSVGRLDKGRGHVGLGSVLLLAPCDGPEPWGSPFNDQPSHAGFGVGVRSGAARFHAELLDRRVGLRSDVEGDGPLQYDAAAIASVAVSKRQGSTVPAGATVFVSQTPATRRPRR